MQQKNTPKIAKTLKTTTWKQQFKYEKMLQLKQGFQNRNIFAG